jgi:hypothetical protein
MSRACLSVLGREIIILYARESCRKKYSKISETEIREGRRENNLPMRDLSCINSGAFICCRVSILCIEVNKQTVTLTDGNVWSVKEKLMQRVHSRFLFVHDPAQC